jgi:hypothetical protein
LAHDAERVLVVDGEVVGDAADARVHVGAAELFGGNDLAGRGLHQRRAAEEDRAFVLHDDRFVGHRRDVRAAGRARAHHRGDLRNPLRRHARLVVEDAPEVIAVGEDFGLQRQERAARIDQVDARQAVLFGDLLRAQMLLDRHRVVGAALDRRVVGDDHAVGSGDRCDPGHDPRRGRVVAIHAVGSQRGELEERRARIDQPVDAVARGQLAALAMPLDCGGPRRYARARGARAGRRRVPVIASALRSKEAVGAIVDPGREQAHAYVLSPCENIHPRAPFGAPFALSSETWLLQCRTRDLSARRNAR